MRPFVLASSSPRRHELLKKLVEDFDIIPVNIDETARPDEKAPELVLRLSRAKAEAARQGVAMDGKTPWILGADTVVVLGERVLGKPGNADEARSMLELLQGRAHDVLTGVCLLNPAAKTVAHEAVVSSVRFRSLAPAEIETYIDSGEPFDKAGGYAVQGLAGAFVERVEGSFSNVVGLPVEYLESVFRRLEISGEIP